MEKWNSKFSVEWAINRSKEDKTRSWREVVEEWEEKN